MTIQITDDSQSRVKAIERLSKRIQSFKDKIAASIKESKRQMEFAGVRMGVFARLKELERDRRRWARKLIELDPANENDYIQHLF